MNLDAPMLTDAGNRGLLPVVKRQEHAHHVPQDRWRGPNLRLYIHQRRTVTQTRPDRGE